MLTVPLAAPEVNEGGFKIEHRHSSTRKVIIYFKVGLHFLSSCRLWNEYVHF